MAHTGSTTNYGLPQWIGSDKPTFLGDFNSAFNTIDTQMKSNADTAAGAAETASSANATAISANETAVTADGKATLAKNTADAASSAAQSASDLATIAKNTADSAAHTAQANNIANLAPAYDETRTYSVGDLVTYVDENNSGKLYKCIIAWNTPGAFNINYWDDVTVSEVFVKKVVLSFTENVGVSHRQFFNETLAPILENLIGTDETKRCKLCFEQKNGANTVRYAFEFGGVDAVGPSNYNRYRFIANDCYITATKPRVAILGLDISTNLTSCNWFNVYLDGVDAISDPGDASSVHMDVKTPIDFSVVTFMEPTEAMTWKLIIE